MSVKKVFFTFFIVVANFFTASAYYEFTKNLNNAYQKILSLQFVEAKLILDDENKTKPNNDLVLLYYNYIDFLKAFISESEVDYELLKENTEHRLQTIIKKKENNLSPFHLYVQSEMLIQQALVGIKFEENLLSAKEIKRAYGLIRKNQNSFPTFILNNKVSGFLHVLIGAVPSRYQWIIRLAGMEGSISEGLEELKGIHNAIGNTEFASYRTEILFYLGNIYSSFSLLEESEELLTTMQPLIGVNPLISFVAANILMKQGKNDLALAAIDSTLKNANAFQVVFLYYKRGLARLRKLDTGAETDFNYFLSHYEGKNNIKGAYQKLAWIALLKSDTVQYKRMLLLSTSKGTTLLDEDKDAAAEAVSGEIVNVYLMRARLLFDGGYYRQSLNEIRSRKIGDFHHFHDQLEVTYRLGRIMQLSNQLDKAIQYYEMTLKNGNSSTYYFAANSSLMLGLIYEEKKEYAKAKSYFEKCIGLNYDQYKNGIDQKAQAGIDRISKSSTKE